MTPRLLGDLDLPVRIALWTAVIVVAVAALEPTVLYLPGSPLVGLAAIGGYLALAHLAIRVASQALGPGAAVPARLFGHGAAVTACGLGRLPEGLVEAIAFVSARLGGLLIGLGLAVAAAAFLRLRRPRRGPA